MTITARAGWAGYVELPSGYTQAEDGTWSTERRFRGSYEAVAALTPGGILSLEHEEGPWWLLRARYQGRLGSGERNPDSEVVTTWSLDPARIEKEIFTLPRAAAQFRTITDPGERARRKAALEKFVAGEAVDYDPASTDSGSPVKRSLAYASLKASFTALGFAAAEFDALVGSLSLGTQAYPLPSVVLRKLQVAPPDATAAPSVADWNRLWTTGTLLTREGATMPAVVRSAIEAVAASTSSAASPGYWFKEFPGYDQRDGTRVEITTQWTFADDFDRYVYGDPI